MEGGISGQSQDLCRREPLSDARSRKTRQNLQHLFHPPYHARPAGGLECGRSACLPACLFLLLTKFLEQAREVPVAEREGRRSQLFWGGGDPRRGVRERGARSRQEPDEARDTHTQTRLGTHTPTLTYSHTLGQVPLMPPTLQGHPDTLNPSCQFSEHLRDTQGDPDPALPPQPTESVWAPDSSRRVEGNTGGKDGRQASARARTSASMRSQSLCKLGVLVATLLSQDLVKQDNLGHLARGSCHSFPHS